MGKKFVFLICFLLTLLSTAGCSRIDRLFEELAAENPLLNEAPRHMVCQVHVTLEPDDTVVNRVYRGQASLNELMQLLRNIDSNKPASNQSSLDESASYFSFTCTYTNGEQREFRLLSHQYFNNDEDGWMEITREQALALTQFVLDSQSDPVFDPSEAATPGIFNLRQDAMRPPVHRYS